MADEFDDIIPDEPAFDFLRRELTDARKADLPPRYLRLVAYGVMTAAEAIGFSAEPRSPK